MYVTYIIIVTIIELLEVRSREVCYLNSSS